MRVLWFTNIPMPAMDLEMGFMTKGSGTWMFALLDKLAVLHDFKIAVVSAYPGRNDAEFNKDGVDYFVIGQKNKSRFVDYSECDFNKCINIVNFWKPDVIHIHGTERFYGLLTARKLILCPTVISIQGLIDPYSKWLNFFGEIPFSDIARAHGFRDFLFCTGLLVDYMKFKNKAKHEREVIVENNFFIGRTDWDRSHLKAVNFKATYYHIDEVIRPEFYNTKWQREGCKQHSIIFTNCGHPRRGTEILLEATALLKKEFPDIELKLAGHIYPSSGYGRTILRRIKKLDIYASVSFLGYLDAQTMASELTKSHVFAIASYIENSPNSLCEAMLVGMPCVASYAGGIPSLFTHGDEGLLFPIGDVPSLADRIRKVFADDALAQRLGAKARERALHRHDPKIIVDHLCVAYQEVQARG